MTQEMVVAGKLRLDQAAAREQMRQAELAFIRARFDLLTAVRRQFLTILAEQERIAVLTQLVAILRNSEQISSDLLRAGRVSETDLLLVRVERRRAEANLGSQQQQIVGDRRQLAALIGLPDFPVGQVVGDLKVRIPLLDAQPLVPEAVDQNALVSKAEAEVRRNQLLLNRAVVEPIPNITWQAGYQRTLSPDSPDQGTIGVYVNPPLWNQNQGNIRAAQAGIRQSLAQLASTRYDLINQLADAESRYRAADAVVRNYEQGVLPDARRGVELIQRGYEQGLFDILRVLQAQRALIEANIDYIQAQQNRLSAGADIAGLLQLETFP
jgi:cobalt-zinc-cadmium efflux system outer membrane protein